MVDRRTQPFVEVLAVRTRTRSAFIAVFVWRQQGRMVCLRRVASRGSAWLACLRRLGIDVGTPRSFQCLAAVGYYLWCK